MPRILLSPQQSDRLARLARQQEDEINVRLPLGTPHMTLAPQAFFDSVLDGWERQQANEILPCQTGQQPLPMPHGQRMNSEPAAAPAIPAASGDLPADIAAARTAAEALCKKEGITLAQLAKHFDMKPEFFRSLLRANPRKWSPERMLRLQVQIEGMYAAGLGGGDRPKKIDKWRGSQRKGSVK
jgi:hypothetical protein